MNAANSGLFFGYSKPSRSGLAEEALRLRAERKARRRAKRLDTNFTPLTPREKKELRESILHDDWHE